MIARTGEGDCPRGCGLSYDWAPVGHRLVVAGVGTGGRRVVTVDAATGKRRDVTPAGDSLTEYSNPHWSADGRLIAYTRHRGILGTASCCQIALVVAAPHGRGLRTLFRFDEPSHDFPFVSWSPDGRQLAFTTDGRSGRDPRLAVVNVTTGKVQRLKLPVAHATAEVIWSPAGGRFAFGTVGPDGGVGSVDADGQNFRQLQAVGFPYLWTRDGKLIIVRGREVAAIRDERAAAAEIVYTVPRNRYILSVDYR